MKLHTMLVCKLTGQIWRVVLRTEVKDYEPCTLWRADDWHKCDLPCFLTARASAEDPLRHHGSYFHKTEAEARERLGMKQS